MKDYYHYYYNLLLQKGFWDLVLSLQVLSLHLNFNKFKSFNLLMIEMVEINRLMRKVIIDINNK